MFIKLSHFLMKFEMTKNVRFNTMITNEKNV